MTEKNHQHTQANTTHAKITQEQFRIAQGQPIAWHVEGTPFVTKDTTNADRQKLKLNPLFGTPAWTPIEDFLANLAKMKDISSFVEKDVFMLGISENDELVCMMGEIDDQGNLFGCMPGLMMPPDMEAIEFTHVMFVNPPASVVDHINRKNKAREQIVNDIKEMSEKLALKEQELNATFEEIQNLKQKLESAHAELESD